VSIGSLVVSNERAVQHFEVNEETVPCVEKSEYQKTMDVMRGQDPKLFPIAQHCRFCTQTREYCFIHGVHYPECSNEPNKQERMFLFP